VERIQELLEEEDAAPEKLGDVRRAVRDLINYGSVRAKKLKDEKQPEYYPTTWIGSGRRNVASLMGYWNPAREIYRWGKRIFGGFFLLVGFILLYQNLTISGSVISGVIGNVNIPVIFPLASLLFGAFLLFLSFKRK
jgi:hypothetical protein